MLLTDCDNAIAATASIDAAHPIVVLLVDDQHALGRVMGEMLASGEHIQFHFCQDPLRAIALAEELMPTVILLDLAMPEIDGLSLLRHFRATPSTREIPVIVLSGEEKPLVKAQAFALGATDYLVKLPDRVELIARIRHHSRRYFAQIQRNEAYEKLAESRQQMAAEVAHAVLHVQSLLPAPLKDGPVRIDWRFVPSTQLGGDAFGYQWLDEKHLAVFLLDVSGHGIGASLLAVSVLNTLLHRTLPHADFYDPSSVMHDLNKIFNMNKHGGRFFTIWYGVFAIADRKLTFSGGGHPPAMLFSGSLHSNTRFQELSTLGPPIGLIEDSLFTNATIQIPNLGRLFLYSDGVVEILRPGGERLDQVAFMNFMTQINHAHNLLEQTLDRGRQMRNGEALTDDCSLMLIDFL